MFDSSRKKYFSLVILAHLVNKNKSMNIEQGIDLGKTEKDKNVKQQKIVLIHVTCKKSFPLLNLNTTTLQFNLVIR